MISCKYFRFAKLLFAVWLGHIQIAPAQQDRARDREDVRLAGECVSILTDVMVHDITSPPVASRDYVYPVIAFYEAVRPGDSTCSSFGGMLRELPVLPKPVVGQRYDWTVAGAMAFYNTALAFVFSKDLFKQAWDSVDRALRGRSDPPDVYARSVRFGEDIATQILTWSRGDHYILTRTLKRFTPGHAPGAWQQTAPEYMEAVEPYWNQIRPMTLGRPDQFLIPEPASFNSQRFLEESKEVAAVGQNLTDSQRAIAGFWDCNPFAVQTIGHFVYSIKKMSPGGHWMNLAGFISAREHLSLVNTLKVYSFVSIALFDGFIAAWDEKYRTNYIRPISAIQQSFAPTWQPMLQTPPFPEYPSAHSVISMATATVLTALFGDHYHYVDATEEPYGLPSRSFDSFLAAANEAAISRMYGGIHFREAIENGKLLGQDIGRQIVERFGLSKLTAFSSL